MFSAISAGLPPCLRELRRVLGYTNRAFPSRFKPRCKKDGSYENMQCLLAGSKSETCWCVDNDGKELIGTRVFGKASCIPESGKVDLTDAPHAMDYEAYLKEQCQGNTEFFARLALQSTCLFTNYLLGRLLGNRTEKEKKIAVYFRKVKGNNLKEMLALLCVAT